MLYANPGKINIEFEKHQVVLTYLSSREFLLRISYYQVNSNDDEHISMIGIYK